MRVGLIPCVCLALLGVGFGGVAAAADAPASVPRIAEDEIPFTAAAFSLQGSNGYRLRFGAYSRRSDGKGRVFVTALKKGRFASYSADGIVSDTYVRADLGGLGKVDLTIIHSGKEKTVSVKCSHDSFTYEPVSYEGIVEFRGEGGYTEAQAESVAATPLFSSFCGGGSGYGETIGPGEPGADLRGSSYAHGRAFKFQVNKNGPHLRTVYQASLKERRQGISIYRELQGSAPAAAFRFDRRLRQATLAPPAPFSGSASLLRTPHKLFPRWSGDLAIHFPGRTVHAAGPAIHVTIRHAHYTQSNEANVEVGF